AMTAPKSTTALWPQKADARPLSAISLEISMDCNGRGGGIRTPDPLLPKQMRYQAALRPDSSFDCNPDRLSSTRSSPAPVRPYLDHSTADLPPSARPHRIRIDATIDRVHGGYSSAAERLTVAQDVVGSIPTSRPNFP